MFILKTADKEYEIWSPSDIPEGIKFNDVTVSAIAEQFMIDIELCKKNFNTCPADEEGEDCSYFKYGMCDKKCYGNMA